MPAKRSHSPSEDAEEMAALLDTMDSDTELPPPYSQQDATAGSSSATAKSASAAFPSVSGEPSSASRIPTPSPNPETTPRHFSDGSNGGYAPEEAMTTDPNAAHRRKRYEYKPHKDYSAESGCCFSDTGGCCCSSSGGCCFSDTEGCCFSSTNGCCFSNTGGCCYSSNRSACCS